MTSFTDKKRTLPHEFSELETKKPTIEYDVDDAKKSLESEWASFMQENNPVIESEPQLNVNKPVTESDEPNWEDDSDSETRNDEKEEEEQKLLDDLNVQKQLYDRVSKLKDRLSDKLAKLPKEKIHRRSGGSLTDQEMNVSEKDSDSGSESDDLWRKKV